MSKQYTTPAANQPSERASDFFNKLTEESTGEEISTLEYLYGRWQDEKEYEDIKDYQKPLNPIAAEFGVTITKMNKRPFGFDFTVDGRTYRFKLRASGSAEYKRIA